MQVDWDGEGVAVVGGGVVGAVVAARVEGSGRIEPVTGDALPVEEPPGVAVGDADAGVVDGAVVAAEDDGVPAVPLGAGASGPVASGEASPEVGAGGFWSSGAAGLPSPPDPPDSAATENIAAAPTTAITPMP